MTNKEKLKEVFGIDAESRYINGVHRCCCTYDRVQERCIENGDCLDCGKWLEAEWKKRNGR